MNYALKIKHRLNELKRVNKSKMFAIRDGGALYLRIDAFKIYNLYVHKSNIHDLNGIWEKGENQIYTFLEDLYSSSTLSNKDVLDIIEFLLIVAP